MGFGFGIPTCREGHMYSCGFADLPWSAAFGATRNNQLPQTSTSRRSRSPLSRGAGIAPMIHHGKDRRPARPTCAARHVGGNV
jgi:hypothetical protein